VRVYVCVCGERTHPPLALPAYQCRVCVCVYGGEEGWDVCVCVRFCA